MEVQAVYSTAGHGLKISLAPHLDLLMRAHLIDNYRRTQAAGCGLYKGVIEPHAPIIPLTLLQRMVLHIEFPRGE